MMHRFLPLFLPILLCVTCQFSPSATASSQEQPIEDQDSIAFEVVEFEEEYQEPEPLSEKELDSIRVHYRQLKAQIMAKRSAFRQQYHAATDQATQELVYKQAHAYLLDAIPEQLLPYWYGTPWDFNGYSNHPREGVIACGYFVSTPLKHIGFPINRYRVAQQAAAIIVDTLCSEEKTYTNVQTLFSEISVQPDELYIVGLDNHVGFLLKKGDQIDFIHSSYYNPVAVVRQDARSSSIFLGSSIHVIGPLLTPEGGLGQWLFAE